MARRACDGAGLLEAFRAAVANLEAHVDEINSLNVFPVPDGDTGSNMLATVKAALEEAESGRRTAGGPDRGGHQLRGAHGRARQLGRHHQPDLPGHGRGPRRQEALQRPRPRPRARPGHEDGLRRGRQAGRGHDPDGHPRVGGGRGRGRRARQRHRGRPGGDARWRREVRRADAEPAGDPARGGRRRLRRAGPVPAVPGGAPATSSGSRRRPRRGSGRADAGPKPSTLVAHADEGFGYETMFLLQAHRRDPARRRRDPRPPRVDRRVGAGRRRRAGPEGPRPQRAAGPRHRLRPAPRAR